MLENLFREQHLNMDIFVILLFMDFRLVTCIMARGFKERTQHCSFSPSYMYKLNKVMIKPLKAVTNS